MRGLVALALAAVALSAPSLAAQIVDYPVVPRSTCAAADTLLGPPAHENDAYLQGYYNSHRDSTYLVVSRRPAMRDRTFVPYSTVAQAGPGPFPFVGLILGVTVLVRDQALDPARDSLTATVVLEDQTTLKLGRLRIGKQFGGRSGVQQLSMVLTRAAALTLMASGSAVMDWGRGHADFEASDIGVLRAFARAEICAPAGIPHPRPTASGQPYAPTPRDWTRLGFGREEIGHPIGGMSCPVADTTLGPPDHERVGMMVGEYDPRTDSTTLYLKFTAPPEYAAPALYDVSLLEKGRGPFPLRELRIHTLDNWITGGRAQHFPDTSTVALHLDTAKESRPLRLLVGQPQGDYGAELTIVVDSADLRPIMAATRITFERPSLKIDWGREPIGALRSFERALLCAPQSIEAHN